MVRLRNTRVQAARDLFYAHVLMREEKKVQRKGSRVLELVTVRRNRNAMIASEILMFMQQVGSSAPRGVLSFANAVCSSVASMWVLTFGVLRD